jgi:hypothetical protein
MQQKNDTAGRAGRVGALVTRLVGRLGPGVTGQRRASIALVGIAVIGALAALTAVAVDLGTGYLAKVTNQRTADSAAFAGALAYNAGNSTVAMTSAVGNLATLNGLAASAATASLAASPSGDGNSAVEVAVTTAVPLYLAEVFRSGTTLSVTATSYAEVKPSASACIIALQAGGAGVNLSGGTSVTANNCAVASNTTVSVPCGTSLTTKTLHYNASVVPTQPCGGIRPPSGTTSVNIVKTPTADPLASNTAVTAAFAHLASVATLTGPAGPAVPTAPDLVFGYSPGSTQTALSNAGCLGSFASPVWTVTCPAGGTYKFGNLTVSGGITLKFAVSGSPVTTYDFSGAINLTGSAATFGPGNFNLAGGIYTGGGTTTSFASGTFAIGPGTVGCSGSLYSICNTGTSLSFGSGSYRIAGGVYNGGGATLSLGAGSTANSFSIGASPSGYAINVGGTSSFGDMASGTFQTIGKIFTNGGTTLTLSAAPAHDLDGSVSLAGSAILGAGTYTVAGNVAFGGSGGGGSVTGSGVSLITSGTFSVAAGYNSVTLTGPASGPLQNLVVASNGTGGASFSEGASGNSLSGALYFPAAPVTLSGAGNVGNGAGQCLELIGSAVTLSGASALASTCSGLGGGSSGGSVVLVQ